MTATMNRYSGPPASIADGWTLSRLTQPSRLSGANGLATGADGRIYCAQVPGSQVSAINPDTGEIETISAMGSDIVAPDDLVFDEHGNMYVTEITENRVSMRSPNGQVTVINGDVPVANPITYHQGRLIAGECRVGARIMELDRDGGAPRIILDNVPMANAFQVGPDGKLYFPAQGANEIWRIDLAGGEPEVVAKDLGVPDSVKFDSKGRIVTTQVVSGQVLRLDIQAGTREVLADLGPGLDNVTFIGDRIFVSSIPGEITEILEPGKIRSVVPRALQWPMGLAVGGDGTLFVADGGFTYALGSSGKLELLGMLFHPGFPGFTRGVAAAGPGEWISTTAFGTVARWNPAAAENELLSGGHELLMGVAVSSAGAVVFADAGRGSVHVAQGGEVREIASGLDRPAGVALIGDTAYVSESGSGRITVLQQGRPADLLADGLGQPEGIAVVGNTLYVLDLASKELLAIDTQSKARTSIAANLPIGAPKGIRPKFLGGVGDMCGPMEPFTGLAAGADGTLYIAANGEGSVLSLKPA